MKNLLLPLITVSLLGALPSAQAATQERQQSMSPEQVLAELKAGNKRFTEGQAADRNLLEEAKKTAKEGQFPLAVVVSCLDSRVPVEMVFDQGIGDVFVGRVAGNVADKDMVGSSEFATKLAGARLVLVLGHDSCGAVQGAIAGAELGNLTQLLEKIAPAEKEVTEFEGEKTAENPEYVDAVAKANVSRVMKTMLEMSPVLKGLVDNGDIMLVGGMYDIKTGEVTFLDAD